ncbi:universal stress protein [Halobacteriales archaeon QS_8_69_26]|nr:MAG: universal stress protein [Halobacteriales archaeon QS_8_69_26]
MYRTILVPTDGSEGAETATREALALAERFDATLHALYVVDTASVPRTIDARNVDRALEEAATDATGTVSEAAEGRGIEVVTDVVHGAVHRSIVDYAEEQDVDLIVMGTHGRQGLERYLIGSVTEKVVRTATVPVLTVHRSREAPDSATGG